jgi:hypothetical protein
VVGGMGCVGVVLRLGEVAWVWAGMKA